MPKIVSKALILAENITFNLLRRAQAAIAGYLNYGNGDLSKYLEREPFADTAEACARHFFPKSHGMVAFPQIIELMLTLLIMAPVLQRLPLSFRFDWHSGHLVSWFRVHCSGRRQRFYFACREVPRQFDPDKLHRNLARLHIHDEPFIEHLADLYRRHYGGTTLKAALAHQLFDPIMLLEERQGYELRYGTKFYRLEQQSFSGSIDIRREPAAVGCFQLQSRMQNSRHFLEVSLNQDCIGTFRKRTQGIIGSKTSPDFKIEQLESVIREFVEDTRHARSAFPQVQELRHWMRGKTRSLSGTKREAAELPYLLQEMWACRVDHRLFLKKPNFFLDPGEIKDQAVYRTFFSPYREV
jgi:hypothetical protein